MSNLASILTALGAAAITLLGLQQADRGIWWHVCQFRGIRKKTDSDQLYRAGAKANKFLVPSKFIPAAIASICIAWMTAVDNAVGALILFAPAVILFVIASASKAYKTLWQFDGR